MYSLREKEEKQINNETQEKAKRQNYTTETRLKVKTSTTPQLYLTPALKSKVYINAEYKNTH